MLRVLGSFRMTFALLGVWAMLIAISPLFRPANSTPFTPPSYIPLVTAKASTATGSSSMSSGSAAQEPTHNQTSPSTTTPSQTQSTSDSAQTTQTSQTTQSVSKHPGSNKDTNTQPVCTKTKVLELIHVDSCLTI